MAMKHAVRTVHKGARQPVLRAAAAGETTWRKYKINIVIIKDMFDCAVHLGHKYLNPQMSKYAQGETASKFWIWSKHRPCSLALLFMEKVVSSGGNVVLLEQNKL